jgi:enterochelin esterase family protein
MPEWKPPSNVIPRTDVKRGKLTEDISINSAKLGYSINYRVYTPHNFNPKSSTDLPVLFITDGSDYWNDEMGGLVITLDNLIADKKIAPILAVFIDPWDRKNNVNRRKQELIPGSDRSCSFCEFIVDELIPEIERAYPVAKRREQRGIVGTSLGGLHATLMALRYGSMFGLIGVQSPAYYRSEWVLDQAGTADPLPIKAFINAGRFEGGYVNSARTLRDTWSQKNANVQYFEVNEGHSWGHWRALLDDMLQFFYPPT